MTKLVSALVFCLLPAAAVAQDLAPDALIKSISDDVIGIVKQDKDIKAGDRTKINALVDAKVLPHFNFARMTALAMGRNWTKANPAQRAALIKEFRDLLVRTYSGALSAYKDQVIDFRPLRAAAGDTDVTVKTRVKQPGGEPVAIDYSMEKTPNGWMVYDVVVGGVSLVTNYRDSFNAEIRESGVDGLIKSLESKNRSLDTQDGSRSK